MLTLVRSEDTKQVLRRLRVMYYNLQDLQFKAASDPVNGRSKDRPEHLIWRAALIAGANERHRHRNINEFTKNEWRKRSKEVVSDLQRRPAPARLNTKNVAKVEA